MTLRFRRASWLAVGLLVVMLAGYYGYRERPVPLADDVIGVPPAIGAWKGEDSDPAPEIIRTPGAHREMSGIYHNAGGRTVHLYLAYFESQAQGRKVVSHVTREWHLHAGPFEIPEPGGSAVRVNRVVVGNGSEARVIFFWYDVGGRVIADRYVAKLATLGDALIRRRSNGAMVAVALEPGVGLDGAGIADELQFLRALLPVLRAQLPLGAA